MSKKTKDDYFSVYEELLGFVPPRVQKRVAMGLELDPEVLDKVEQMRTAIMYPSCLDMKTTQIILFAVLLANLSPAARLHAIAAKRAGATKQELHAVTGLTFLFRGLSAFNIGCEILEEVFREEGSQA